MWECGLKRCDIYPNTWRAKSLLMWECGLKLTCKFRISHLKVSLLMWECGLKHRDSRLQRESQTVTPYVGVWIETQKTNWKTINWKVTPYVGVWIETVFNRPIKRVTQSLLMWECGLKHRFWNIFGNGHSHSLCGSVDWNTTWTVLSIKPPSHSLCGSVDWNRWRRK